MQCTIYNCDKSCEYSCVYKLIASFMDNLSVE